MKKYEFFYANGSNEIELFESDNDCFNWLNKSYFLSTRNKDKNPVIRIEKEGISINFTGMNVNRFYGDDTFGTHIEVGIRADGQMYWRAYKFNGYGMGWSKWEKLETRDIYINVSGKPAMKWGFNELTGYFEPKSRLPKD